MRKYCLLLLLCLNTVILFAQDIQYSQFYAAPMYLNPAFAGSAEMTRVGVNFRNQWPSLDRSFVAYSAYVDHFFENKNSGIGLIINGSQETLSNLQNHEIGLLYSYRLKLGENGYLHFGLQGSYGLRAAAFDEIILGTQLDIDRGVVLPSPSNGLIDDRQIDFFDLHSGILYYNDKIWFGLATHHLTQPNMSYLMNERDVLFRKYSAHGGVKFPLRPGFINDYFNNTLQDRTISFAFNYKRQGIFDQLDIGTELFFEPLVLGLWYRGLPSFNGLPNNDALIGVVGFSLDNGMDIGYSYDFTISSLGFRNSGGAHEVSMRYSFVDQLWNRGARKSPTFRY
ncbi:PorP/SprF family type IX secretion system membrane protein [Mongoliibacter ruber]|uniref:Type IX secretion system PorP/SprF family membrane protein n=1 Tax=Mongoliibacter ruber TaxID=1750599 RepID=A0A2T0WBB8_9BACT|nr:type IX secretion system membrane protein PorP/SprF [Mongoliibacter ruber]PRY84009.1 type IX secretion system PorP/SprF family membrane protein [Mongoliibacter ruber]